MICLTSRPSEQWKKNKPLAYLNSLLQLSLALNQGDFAKTFSVGSGNDWHVEVWKK
ncbi:MAG: SAM hydroxide adenosyltransferase [Puia sp.]